MSWTTTELLIVAAVFAVLDAALIAVNVVLYTS